MIIYLSIAFLRGVWCSFTFPRRHRDLLYGEVFQGSVLFSLYAQPLVQELINLKYHFYLGR